MDDEAADLWVTAKMDAGTAQRVRTLLADRRGRPAPPLDTAVAAVCDARDREVPQLVWVAPAAVVDAEELADPDAETLVALVAATISPLSARADVPAAVREVDHVAGLSLVVRLVLRGAGANGAPDSLLADVEEVAPAPLSAEERTTLRRALDAIVPAWQALGVLDDEQRLTDAGAWLLPRAACYAWDSDFDDPESVDGPGEWEVPVDDERADLDEDERAIADAAVDQLAATGALDREDLARALGDDLGEPVDPRDLHRLLFAIPRLMPLRDGRWVHLPSLMDGMVLTHRLTAVERGLDALLVDPDLYAFVWIPGDFDLAGGGTVGIRFRRGHPMDVHDALVGPEGWLDGFEVGDLLAVRLQGGAVAVERVEEAALDLDAAARTAARLVDTHEMLEGKNPLGGPIDVPELLLETLARAPLTLGRPHPPLGELLEQAGLDPDHLLDGDGPYDTEDAGSFAGGEVDPVEEHDAMLAERYGHDEAALDAHHRLLADVARIARDGIDCLDEAALEEAAGALGDAAVAESLADAVLRLDRSMVEALGALAQAAHGRGRGRRRAGVAYLRARVAELLGATEEGEVLLTEALTADPDCRPALLDAAWYAEDRGDAVRAVSLLRRARVEPGDPQLDRLAAWAAPAPAGKVGRNDPCPCGSGRKFKVCCQRRGGQPLAARAGWLLDKAGTYAHRPLHRPRLLPLVEARAGDPGDPHRLLDAMRDPLVQDLALFEEGILELFLDDRGVLLPADELALGRSWLGTPRSLLEVTAVRPGEGLTLLDLRTGDRLDVVERTASRTIRAGETVLSRPLPVGDSHVLAAGNVRVPVTHRETLLAFLDVDPGGPQLAAWVAALEAPPRMVTMEGEQTVFCEAVYEVADAPAAARALDERYERQREDRWAEPVDTDTGTWTRGTLHLEGERLVVHTNAVPRLERFKHVLDELLPDATLVDEERRTLDDVRRSGAPLPEPAEEAEEAEEAELDAALDEMIRDYEDQWVDESIPALGGLTPRQAAEDPTRRDQLRALLDEMETTKVPAGGRGMDAGRLRRRLGL